MAKEKITPEGIRRAMEQDKDKIEAALANAVTMANGTHPEKPKPTRKPRNAKELDMKPDPEINKFLGKTKEEKVETPKADERVVEENEISAKDMFLISSQNPDPKIHEHIKALNARIRGEAERGGFSTNIGFSVLQNDWVNIQHILDWYRARGFQIINFEQTTSPYGKNAGAIQYNFTISWAVPA